jgi:hypothetical protein
MALTTLSKFRLWHHSKYHYTLSLSVSSAPYLCALVLDLVPSHADYNSIALNDTGIHIIAICFLRDSSCLGSVAVAGYCCSVYLARQKFCETKNKSYEALRRTAQVRRCPKPTSRLCHADMAKVESAIDAMVEVFGS